MKTSKRSDRGKLSVSEKKISVAPPAGYHWMEEQGRFYLMEGEYKPHPGAMKEAEFRVASHS